MGCSTSKDAGSAVARMLEYEQVAATSDLDLRVVPAPIDLQDWKGGIISPRTLYNLFHGGYCSAYIQNPTYLLVLDFRSLEEWLEERVATSLHHTRLHHLHKCLARYSSIVLYDRDGSSIGNLRSPLWRAYTRMVSGGLEPRVLLGGLRSLLPAHYSSLLDRPTAIPYCTVQPTVHNSLQSLESAGSVGSVGSASSDHGGSQPELETVRPQVGLVEPARRALHWMPSMLVEDKVYLGRADQASDPEVVRGLGITHVLSTSRIRASKFRGLVYILVNKDSFSASTLKLTTNFLVEAVAGGGRVLVHGCDGFDQSAAVAAAALMRSYTATLEDCLWLVSTSRPGIRISPPWLTLLSRLEEEQFGRAVTDLESLWCTD